MCVAGAGGGLLTTILKVSKLRGAVDLQAVRVRKGREVCIPIVFVLGKLLPEP